MRPPQRRSSLGISTAAGASSQYFGHKDYYAAKNKGFSDRDILQYLDANPNVLRGNNRKGGGRLYDEISGGNFSSNDDGMLRNQQSPNIRITPAGAKGGASGSSSSGGGGSNVSDIDRLRSQFDQSSLNYQNDITSLRNQVGNYQGQISSYQDQIRALDSRLLEQSRLAKQFQQMDTRYLSNNQASGIRLRRSKRAKAGMNAMGTSALSRRNRRQLSIGNVNL